MIAILTGRFFLHWIPRLKLGSASSFPGYVAKKLYPRIYPMLLRQAKNVIYVTGTNGKTTTTRLLSSFFGESETLTNASGANLETGLITALLKGTKGKILVLEVDERALTFILRDSPPDILICLNLFRDQLDRFGEVDAILEAWKLVMNELPHKTRLVFNGDDPSLVHLGRALERPIDYFGLSEPERGSARHSHAVDATYCPSCHSPLVYATIYLSHLGDFSCPSCDFQRETPRVNSQEWPSVSPHLHSKYNTMAAITAAQIHGLDKKALEEKIETFMPAFGRGETLHVQGREVLILLSKNAVSLNTSLQLAKEKKVGCLVFALNNEEADGRDVSWIWDADLEEARALSKNVLVCGRKADDMALCLTYHSVETEVFPDISEAVQKALVACPHGMTVCVIPTYTAMLEVRRGLTGKAFS